MINRTAQVSDFGFCMLDNMEDCELYEPESEASDDSHRPSPAASTNDLPAAGEVGVPAETAHAQQLPAPGTNKPSSCAIFLCTLRLAYTTATTETVFLQFTFKSTVLCTFEFTNACVLIVR
jgi:hypothetical protein